VTEPAVVLLSVSSFGVADPAPRERLEAAGLDVRDNPHGRRLKVGEISELIGEVDALIAGTEPLNGDVLGRAGRLRVISRVGVGLENVDLNAALRQGIVVRNTPDAVTDPVAELALSGILNLLRHISRMDREMRAGEWNRRMGNLLRGRTVGVVGLGRIGRRLAALLAPFEVTLLAADRAPDHHAAARLNVRYVGLEELLARADVVTLHLPGGDRPIIGAPELAMMKPGAVLLNTSRGGLVDENALLEALRDERLAAAYIDTFVDEPYDGPLRELPNVLLTPHAGSYAAEARLRMEMEAVENLLEALEEFR
jgi:D-3-phosphoglycerate dehydrogenase